MAKNPAKFIRPYIAIPRSVIESPAYLQLSPPAKCLIPLLQSVWHHKKQDSVSFGVEQAAYKIGVGKSTASRSFKELVKFGFIDIVNESDWLNGKARYYKLNWQPYHAREPSDDYKNWEYKN